MLLLKVCDDCSLLPLSVQMVKVVCGLITIFMQKHSSPESVCGCLLLAMLLEVSCCVTELIQSLLTGRICQVCSPSSSSTGPQSPKLLRTLSVEGGAITPGNILHVGL